jgi:hypothetical protein
VFAMHAMVSVRHAAPLGQKVRGVQPT